VTRINTSFPHWFNGAFKEFNDRPERLPFDQHCLAALCAPRPVLFSNAVEDTWANPEGQFEVLKAAEPVYQLLGAGGLDAKTMPGMDKLIDSTLGYYIRAGKHDDAHQRFSTTPTSSSRRHPITSASEPAAPRAVLPRCGSGARFAARVPLRLRRRGRLTLNLAMVAQLGALEFEVAAA
jgi:hypothetical protein